MLRRYLRKKRKFMEGRLDFCTLAPDFLPFIGFIGDCCEEHDADYARGGTEKDRERYDEKFRDCIQGKGKGQFAFLVSRIYYKFVRWFGDEFGFNYHDQ